MKLFRMMAAFLAVFAAVPATAGTVVYTFTGTVLSGGGYPFGAVTAGTPFSAKFVWTPEVSPYQITHTGSAQSVSGGTPQNIAATLTINSISYAFGSEFGSILRENDHNIGSRNGPLDSVSGYASNFNGRSDMLGLSMASFANFVDDASLIAPGSYDLTGSNEYYSYYRIGVDFIYNQPDYGSGLLDARHVDITVNGPITINDTVPEPASWALLIGGFGLVGAAARRRYPRAATM